MGFVDPLKFKEVVSQGAADHELALARDRIVADPQTPGFAGHLHDPERLEQRPWFA